MDVDENGYSAEWRMALALERIAAVLEGIVSNRAAKNAAAVETDEKFRELLRQRLPGYKG